MRITQKQYPKENRLNKPVATHTYTWYHTSGLQYGRAASPVLKK
jgi:hypothetical protein